MIRDVMFSAPRPLISDFRLQIRHGFRFANIPYFAFLAGGRYILIDAVVPAHQFGEAVIF